MESMNDDSTILARENGYLFAAEQLVQKEDLSA